MQSIAHYILLINKKSQWDKKKHENQIIAQIIK